MFRLVPSGRLQVVDCNAAAPVSESAMVPTDHTNFSTTDHSNTEKVVTGNLMVLSER